MNIWLKTQNSRHNRLRESLTGSSVASASSIRTPLPIILENQKNDQMKSNSNISIQIHSQSQQSDVGSIVKINGIYNQRRFIGQQENQRFGSNRFQINRRYIQMQNIGSSKDLQNLQNYDKVINYQANQLHQNFYQEQNRITNIQKQQNQPIKNNRINKIQERTNLMLNKSSLPMYSSLVSQTFSSSQNQNYKSSSSSSISLPKYKFSKNKKIQNKDNQIKNIYNTNYKSQLLSNIKRDHNKEIYIQNRNNYTNYSILGSSDQTNSGKSRKIQREEGRSSQESSSILSAQYTYKNRDQQQIVRNKKNEVNMNRINNGNQVYQNKNKYENTKINKYNIEKRSQNPIQNQPRYQENDRNKNKFSSKSQILNNINNKKSKQKLMNKLSNQILKNQHRGYQKLRQNNNRQFEADRQVRQLKLPVFSNSNSSMRTPVVINERGSFNIRNSSSQNQSSKKIYVNNNKQTKQPYNQYVDKKNNLNSGHNPASRWKSSINSFNSLHIQNSQKTPNLLNSTNSLASHMNSYHHSLNGQSSHKKMAHHTNSKRLLTTARHYDRRQYIISIIQYCSNQVGMACYHIATGQIKLTQIIQRMTYIKTISTLQRFYPQQIIFSSTLEDTLLMKKLIQNFRRTSFRPIKRALFDQTKGYYIYTLRGNKNEHNPDHKFLAYAALHALLTTMQSTFDFTLTYSALNIKWHYLQQVLVIDSQTISDLQIFINKQTKIIKNTFIDNFKCLTDGGMRMLRANILQPLTDLNSIKQRFDLVQILLKNQNKGILDMLIRQLIKLKNYEPITAKFIQNPKCDNIRSVKSYLNGILILSRMCFQLQNLQKKIGSIIQNPNILNPTDSKQNPILKTLHLRLTDPRLQQIRKIIQQNFQPQILKSYQNTINALPHQLNPQKQKKLKGNKMLQTTQKNKRDNFIFLFKLQKIADQFAQISRLTYSHTIQDILKIHQQIKQKCPTDMHLKLLYNDHRGYYLSAKSSPTNPLDLSHISNIIQDDIIYINTKNNIITFSTSILISLNNRLKQNQHKLIYQSIELLINIIKDIQKNIDILFQVNYWISLLDMVIGFVMFVKEYQGMHNVVFSRPIFNTGGSSNGNGSEYVLKIQKLRTIWTMQKFHKLSSQISLNLTVGTSALIIHKQLNSFDQLNILYSIGFLTILSQIGCLVPAGQYYTSIYDTLISKMQVQGNLQNKLSHFQMQIISLRNILQNICSHEDSKQTKTQNIQKIRQQNRQYRHKQRKGKCLILIDQICKGTKPQQQYALSLSAVDQLTNNCKQISHRQQPQNIAIILISDGILFKMCGQFNKVQLCQFTNANNTQQQQQDSIRIKQKQLLQCIHKYNYHPNFVKIYNNQSNKIRQ